MDILIGVVTGSEVAVNRDGSVPGRLLQVVITDVHDVQTVEMPQDGEESNPIPGCRVFIEQAGHSYKVVSRVDDGVAPVMDPGGKRIYSVGTDGVVKAEVRLFPDGTAKIQNANGSFTMHPDGTFSFQGDLTVQGKITATDEVKGSDLLFGAKRVSTHVHGTSVGNTTAPL